MNEDKLKLTCPSCGGNQFSRKPGEFLECKYCGLQWKFKDGHIEASGYKRCKCGFANSPTSIYCQNCQARLKINCPDCDTLVDLDANFCSNCMVNIEKALEIQHSTRINQIEKSIASKDAEINRLKRYIESAKQVAQKLCFLGKSGLTDDEKSIFSSMNANIGCLSPVLLTILAIIIVDLITSRILHNMMGLPSVSNPSPVNTVTIDKVIMFYCLDLAIAILLGRLIAVLILREVRINRVDQYCEPYVRQISQNTKEKETLKEDLEKVKAEYTKIMDERSLET